MMSTTSTSLPSQHRLSSYGLFKQLQSLPWNRLTLALSLIFLGAVLCGAPVARAQTTCVSGKYDTIAQGNYILENDVFNVDGVTGWWQMICNDDTASNAWTSTWDWPTTTTSVKSFPAIYVGWNFGDKNTPTIPGVTNFPVQISAMHELPTTVSFSMTGTSTYDTAYDLFFSPYSDPSNASNPNPGMPSAEMMVWLNELNSDGTARIPYGTKIASAITLGSESGTWDVYTETGGTAPNTWPLYIFVRTTQVTTFTGNLRPFIYYLSYTNSYLPVSDYELGIFFGVEVRNNTGSSGHIGVTNFSASVD